MLSMDIVTEWNDYDVWRMTASATAIQARIRGVTHEDMHADLDAQQSGEAEAVETLKKRRH